MKKLRKQPLRERRFYCFNQTASSRPWQITTSIRRREKDPGVFSKLGGEGETGGGYSQIRRGKRKFVAPKRVNEKRGRVSEKAEAVYALTAS